MNGPDSTDRWLARQRDLARAGDALRNSLAAEADLPPPVTGVALPPETKAERRDRWFAALTDHRALGSLGGMVIAAFAVGLSSGVGPGLLLGGAVLYLANASRAALRLRRERDRDLADRVARGLPLPAPPPPLPTQAPRSLTAADDPSDPPDALRGRVLRLGEIIGRIKSQMDVKSPLVAPEQLDRYARLAGEFESRWRDVAAYLTASGGASGAGDDVTRLRAQLASLGPDDHRRDTITGLLATKERTAKNLAELERFQETVELKLEEQIAQLESLESSLLRVRLGSFEEEKRAEATVGGDEIAAMARGLETTAEDMRRDLTRVTASLG